MRYEFHPEARAEYLAAVARYEDRQSGLGTRFMIEIEDAIQRVVQAPSRWRNIRGDVRRCLAHKFPYGVLYPWNRIMCWYLPSCITVANRTIGIIAQIDRSLDQQPPPIIWS